MENLLLFDDPSIRGALLPFTFTRPIAAIRIGILTIAEKWEKISGKEVSYLTQDYLQEKYPRKEGAALAINGGLIPSQDLL
ncbi:MAG: glucose-1-phosphate thymidylyltransferase, partial [Cyclobacteriaceae bacterium]|nr:glucose-1-phosphate thymidylyltransferase [Cyclobacteriaceae bacterium]